MGWDLLVSSGASPPDLETAFGYDVKKDCEYPLDLSQEWKNDKTDSYVQGRSWRNGLSSDSSDRGNYPLRDRKEEIKGNDLLLKK